MFLEKITWKQAEGYFKEKDIAIIPVGSTENHGSQLCLGTDFLIPRRLCEMMDERLNILIAPTVPFGVGDQHINFPGTITIGYDGLYDLMTRIVDQLYGFGIRKPKVFISALIRLHSPLYLYRYSREPTVNMTVQRHLRGPVQKLSQKCLRTWMQQISVTLWTLLKNPLTRHRSSCSRADFPQVMSRTVPQNSSPLHFRMRRSKMRL